MRVARALVRRFGPVFPSRLGYSEAVWLLQSSTRSYASRISLISNGQGGPNPDAIENASTFAHGKDTAYASQTLSSSTPSTGLAPITPSTKVDLGVFEELQYQSDVTAPPTRGLRLVDQPQHTNDFGLWAQFLDFRLRIEGLDGALSIWRGIQERDLELPTTGAHAVKLWSAIASVAIQFDLLHEVWQYAVALAKKTSRRYEGLYEAIIGYYLRTQPAQVLPWHRKFRELDLPAAGNLVNLVDDAVQTKRSLKTFRRLYNEADDHTIYDSMITCLCNRGLYEEAVMWHRHFMAVNDLPSNASVLDLLRDYLALNGDQEVLREITNDLVTRGVSFANTIPRTLQPNTKISREMMSRMLGESHGVTPKIISDRFSARMFATKAFSIDFAIAGLTSFGFDLLGPLSMRELALRCKGAEEILARITQLEHLKVELSPCVYVQLVRRLAMDGRENMLDAVLQSDQHPDVFDDRKLQRQLLEQYVRTQDWPQVHRTLTVLTAFHEEPEVEAWNLVLRAHMANGSVRKVREVFDDMLANRVRITPGTVKCSFFKLLRPRNAGKRPVTLTRHFDDLSFLTVMWLKILRSGGRIPVAAWSQIHNYYGMEGRIHELERLTLWLVQFYTRQATVALSEQTIRTPGFRRLTVTRVRQTKAVSSNDWQSDLKSMFGPIRQAAMVSWAFKTIGWGPKKVETLRRRDQLAPTSMQTNLGRYEPWARGVALLKVMKQRGIPVEQATVRKAVRQCLLILFGPGRSNRLDNRAAVQRNTMSMSYMVRYLNGVWKGNLLDVPPALLRMEGPAAEHLLHKIVLGNATDATLELAKTKLVRTRRRTKKSQLLK